MPPHLNRSHALRGLRRDLQAVKRRLRPAAPAPVPEPNPEPEPTPAQLRRTRQRERVASYLEQHDVAKMEIGSGNTVVDGWLGTDIAPRHRAVLELDATKRFPLPDSSLDYIHAEHLIEHITYLRGQKTLAQCRRVLKPGGVVRLATPNLERLIAVYRGDAGPEGEHYLQWAHRTYASTAPRVHPVFMLNRQMRYWGHTFLYDPEVLRMALEDAGFLDVEQCELGVSRHEALQDVERHHKKAKGTRDRAIRFETMVFEGTCPPDPA